MPPDGVNLPKNTNSRRNKDEKTVARVLKGLPSIIYTKKLKLFLQGQYIFDGGEPGLDWNHVH